jgi:uncharacterized protein YndB with AHSA1/START domain
MSVKIDASGRRSIQVEVEVPGTPEEVWRAIATGPGVSSWFVPCEIDGREGGTVTSHFGPGMDSVATITAWDPPRRFAADSSGLGPEAPTMATEWIVEARSGDTCVVRVVHSLFASTDDWDNQLEAVESGWPGFFRILRLYLTHFRGLPSAAFQLMAASPASEADAWKTFTTGLGLQEGAAEGHRLTATAAGAPPLGGIVEGTGDAKHQRVLFLRLDEPGPGAATLGAFRMGEQTLLMVSLYLYGENAAALAARTEPVWQEWLQQQFAPASAADCGA